MLSARERAAASVLATVGSGLACGWWAQGLKPRSQSRLWVERVRLLGVPLAFLSDTLLGKPHAATPCNGSNYQDWGDIGHELLARIPRTRPPRGAAWGVASAGGGNVPLTTKLKEQHAGLIAARADAKHHVKQSNTPDATTG